MNALPEPETTVSRNGGGKLLVCAGQADKRFRRRDFFGKSQTSFSKGAISTPVGAPTPVPWLVAPAASRPARWSSPAFPARRWSGKPQPETEAAPHFLSRFCGQCLRTHFAGIPPARQSAVKLEPPTSDLMRTPFLSRCATILAAALFALPAFGQSGGYTMTFPSGPLSMLYANG